MSQCSSNYQCGFGEECCYGYCYDSCSSVSSVVNLSVGVIAAISIGSILFCAGCIGLCVYLCTRSSRGNRTGAPQRAVVTTTTVTGQNYPVGGQQYPPQQGVQYPPQQGVQYPPQQGVQYPPQQGVQYPPQQGVQYPPQQGYPPQQEMHYPPHQAMSYPPANPAMEQPPPAYPGGDYKQPLSPN